MTKSMFLAPVFLVLSVFAVSAQGSYFTDDSPDVVRYKVTTDVIFGEGKVLKDGKEAVKKLWMDVYTPAKESKEPRPAIILSYGGAHHRGNPRIPYVGLGSQTTTMSQYACLLYTSPSPRDA